jgi:hypothetical protein
VKIVFLIFIFFTSCSSILSSGSPKEIKQRYAFIDGSGKYIISREHKLLKNKLISRSQISSNQGSAIKPLEKSIMVSQLGSIKEKTNRIQVMRPFASEFTVWLEGKRYNSKMRLDVRNKAMVVELTSPEEKWKGKSSIPFPKGKQFCFFSQIPDCLYHNQFLTKALARKGENLSFYVVWDGYPYIQEQYTGVGSKLFSPAVVRFDGEHKKAHRYLVEVEGQSIIYNFSKNFDFVRMFWIAQGISIVPPNEETVEGEE